MNRLKYNNQLNWNDIYEYPFSDNIDSFLIVENDAGWIIDEVIFESYLSVLKYLNIDKLNIEFLICPSYKVKKSTFYTISIKDFSYENYYNMCKQKWNHYIFISTNDLIIATSEEWFSLIWWKKKLLFDSFIPLTKKEYLWEFIVEYWADNPHNWAYNIVNHPRFVKDTWLI